MRLLLTTILNDGYNNVQAQKILDTFHTDTPDYMTSYRIYDGEKGNGGKVTKVVRRML